MKRNSLLAAMLLLLSLALVSCGATSGGERPPMPSSAPAAGEMGIATESVSDMAMPEPQEPSSGGSVYADENAKIIRTASLYLQSTDFDAAVAALNSLVESQGGYFQSATQDSGSYNSGSTRRYGYYTVRVPKESFDAFLSAVGELAHVVSRTVESQDVGEAYYDAELRLATLKTKHERLLALLDKAELMQDIINLESALSDVEYEIQQYTSTLDRYDGLVDFSTVTIELQEVARVSDSTAETDSLGARLSTAFSTGWANFCDGVANFTVWVAYHFVGCIIFVVVVAAAAVAVKKRFFPAKPKQQFPPSAPEQ